MDISVIIPSFNASAVLPRAIESACAQTLLPREIIVVDDGSTDGTADLCRSYGEKIKYIHRENGGLAAARNSGAALAAGDWLLFLDADDSLYPHSLASLAHTAHRSNAGVVYGFVLQRRGSSLKTRLHGLPYAVGEPPAPSKAHFWWTAISTAGSALIRKSLNDSLGGFDENFRQVEDCEYWLRCGIRTAFAHCDQIVLDKSFSSDSLGQHQEGSIWYRLQLQQKFLLWCRLHDIDTKFLAVTESDIIDHALTRIHRQRCWSILEPVLRHAQRANIRTPWYFRSLLVHSYLRLIGRLPAQSARCKEVYRMWLDAARPTPAIPSV